MAAFDATLEMQQIEEMDEEDVKEELAAAGEKVSGTRRRLNERLHARRCKDAAEATAAAAAADEGDEESPLSDDDLKILCQRKMVARAPTDTRHDRHHREPRGTHSTERFRHLRTDCLFSFTTHAIGLAASLTAPAGFARFEAAADNTTARPIARRPAA